jgi:hypothetical protein
MYFRRTAMSSADRVRSAPRRRQGNICPLGRADLFCLNKRAERVRDRLPADAFRTELRRDLGGCHALRVLGYDFEHCRLNEASPMFFALWGLRDLKWP